MSSQVESGAQVVRRVLEGVVVSDKMQKTIVVKVERAFQHPRLGKIVRRAKKYKAHDELGTAKMGDVVQIIESSPLSKTKHMILSRVLSTGNRG
jgi:small subunit ribosomal protein S17